jgi:hypothetical protein
MAKVSCRIIYYSYSPFLRLMLTFSIPLHSFQLVGVHQQRRHSHGFVFEKLAIRTGLRPVRLWRGDYHRGRNQPFSLLFFVLMQRDRFHWSGSGQPSGCVRTRKKISQPKRAISARLVGTAYVICI